MKSYKIAIVLVLLGLMGLASATVNLGTAGKFVILTKSGITTTGTTSIVGDIGVSPITYAAITGFALTPVVPNGSNTFATSPLVTGRVYAADYTEPTPTNLGIAVLDMEAAYTDAAGRPAGVGAYLNVGGGTLAGQNFFPGTYTWGSNVTITDNITFTGGANDVWILQISGTLYISSGKKVILRGGAQAKNIFWAVAGVVALGTTSEFNGNILAKTNITMNTGATLNGRALAQTAVTLIANIITVPGGSVPPPPPPPPPPPTPQVDLGSAGSFVILTKSGITTTGTTSIVGDIGVSPITYAAITGFSLTPVVPNGSNTFATSPLVTGRVYAADYTEPTPTNLGIAVLDMEAAYTDAAGRPAGVGAYLNVGGGTLAGQNFFPGTYTWGSNVTITDNITFTGGANDVWILQISGTLDISSGKKVILSGGAQAKNIFWAVAGVVALGTTSEFNGNILAKTNITMNTGATLNGRALAQTAVTLIANAVTEPSNGAIDDIDINVNPSVQVNTSLLNNPTTTTTFALMPNRPNPFESRTTIQWQVPVSSNITILIYDATGRVVKTLVNGNYNPGSYTTNWNRSDDNNQTVAAGVYFYEMRANNYVSRHKMIITH